MRAHDRVSWRTIVFSQIRTIVHSIVARSCVRRNLEKILSFKMHDRVRLDNARAGKREFKAKNVRSCIMGHTVVCSCRSTPVHAWNTRSCVTKITQTCIISRKLQIFQNTLQNTTSHEHLDILIQWGFIIWIQLSDDVNYRVTSIRLEFACQNILMQVYISKCLHTSNSIQPFAYSQSIAVSLSFMHIQIFSQNIKQSTKSSCKP